MTGVLVSEDVIATDGHVLSFCSLIEGQKDEDLSLLKGTNILVPQKVLNLVLKSASENAGIFANEKYIRFDFKNSDFEYTIFSKLIDETYPNYKAVLPKDYSNRIWVNRIELLKSIQRLSLFSSSTTHQIKIEFSENMKISALDFDMGAEANETLNVKCEGDNMEVGLNANYAIQTLQAMQDEEIMIEYDTPIKAVVLEGKEHKCIIMPVRLN
jgi:DNA polymerase-3 subunit beta